VAELLAALGTGLCAGLAISALVLGARAARARRRARRAFGHSAGPSGPDVRLPIWLVGRSPLADTARVPRAWLPWLALAVAAAVPLAALAAGPFGVALALAVVVAAPCWWARARHRRGMRSYELALPEWLAALARALRSGATVRVALGEAGDACGPPLRDDVRRLHAEALAGHGLGGGLEAWAAARPLPAVRLAAAALAIGERTGGLSARAVDDLALVVRARLDGRAEVWALTAQVRASAWVMVVAPLAFLVLVAWSDPAVRTFLTRTPAGWSCLAGGLLLDALAAWAMARLLRSFG
jgi:tight adherence protein B